MRAGLDPRVTPIPVAAAAHYHMGGIAADPDGRTTLEGLFAVGECAATGVHGANRLASNSLLEAAAFGRRTGRAAAAKQVSAEATRDRRRGCRRSARRRPAELRAAMSADAGVVRDAAGLTRLIALIDRLEAAHGARPAAGRGAADRRGGAGAAREPGRPLSLGLSGDGRNARPYADRRATVMPEVAAA